MNRLQHVAMAALVIAGVALPAAAQVVTQADIQRLQDNVNQATDEVGQAQNRDASAQPQLDDLRDEVIYLKVKLRKQNTVSRAEYIDVRDRIASLRSRALGDNARFTPRQNGNTRGETRGTAGRVATREVPVGTEMDVRLQSALNSGTAVVEDRFDALTMVDLVIDGRTLIPAGSTVRGVVTAVDPAGRVNRTAKMTVSFDQVTIDGRGYPMRGTVTEAIESGIGKGDVGKIGAGAGVGAIIGGILGGTKGAIAGILIGGGGTIAATKGNQVSLDQGDVLRVRLDSPLSVGSGTR